MAKRKRKKARPKETADLGTAERENHHMGLEFGARVISDAGIVVHHGAKAVAGSTIEVLYKSGLLDGDQGGRGERKAIARSRLDAGERLHRMFMAAGLNQLKAVDLNRSGGGGEPGEELAQALAEFNALVRRMGTWMNCLTSVVMHDRPPATLTDVRNVRAALDRLCVEFKL